MFLDGFGAPSTALAVEKSAPVKLSRNFGREASALSHAFDDAQNLHFFFIDYKLVVFAAAFAKRYAAVNFAGPLSFCPSRLGKLKRVAVVRLRVTRCTKRNGCPPSFRFRNNVVVMRGDFVTVEAFTFFHGDTLNG